MLDVDNYFDRLLDLEGVLFGRSIFQVVRVVVIYLVSCNSCGASEIDTSKLWE
jgi:hypothetical protein